MVPRNVKRLLLVGVATAGAVACSLVAPRFERPTLSVVSIELVGGNLLHQNFLVKFNVQNPNDRALPVTGLHAELNVMGERIATGVSNRAFVVPAYGATEFDMNISANLALVVLKLKGRSGSPDSIDYDMSGAASVDLPFLRDVPFHQGGTFSLRGLQ
jgi:LEA14-like dessication related protein